jgi:hypothetical protein
VITDVQAAAAAMGQQLEILTATTNRDISPAFSDAVQKRADALLIHNCAALALAWYAFDRRHRIRLSMDGTAASLPPRPNAADSEPWSSYSPSPPGLFQFAACG